jgi:hypothetical protein
LFSPDLKTLAQLGIALVILHALVVVPHAIAHNILHIDLNLWQSSYIFLVILLGPLVSAFLLWKRAQFGFLLLTLSMGGSFLFGVYYHFIAGGPDNVASLVPHPWTHTFQVSAVLLAITEAASIVVGALGLRRSGVQES